MDIHPAFDAVLKGFLHGALPLDALATEHDLTLLELVDLLTSPRAESLLTAIEHLALRRRANLHAHVGANALARLDALFAETPDPIESRRIAALLLRPLPRSHRATDSPPRQVGAPVPDQAGGAVMDAAPVSPVSLVSPVTPMREHPVPPPPSPFSSHSTPPRAGPPAPAVLPPLLQVCDLSRDVRPITPAATRPASRLFAAAGAPPARR